MKKLITLLFVVISTASYSQSSVKLNIFEKIFNKFKPTEEIKHKPSESEIESYYEEITGYWEGGENKTPSKYKKDVKIFVAGEINDSLKYELDRIIVELNELIETVEIGITTEIDSSNLYLYLGTFDDFINSLDEPDYMKEWRRQWEDDNTQGVFWTRSMGSSIMYSKAIIKIHQKSMKNSLQLQKSVLREEITQSLGFPNDTYEYENSIFYERNNNVTEYSDLDREIIKRHYLSQK